MAAAKPGALFICYSHTDQKYREQFSKFLQGKRLGDLKIFSDAAIRPGDRWQSMILQNLREATAALVLVSQDFMVSPFIQQVELRSILTNHIRRGLRLFLVPVRPTNYQGTYLERFQWARPPDQPLSLLSEAEQERAMVDVCMRISKQLKTDVDATTIEQTIECLNSVPKLDLPSMYELEGPVGEGEFARCFKARDTLLDRDVIIKVLNTELSRDSPAYDKYVRSASRLSHRNIVPLLFSQANKLPHFLVVPAVGEKTLKDRLASGRLPLKTAVAYTRQLAGALAYAHRQKCVHGRLRPCEVRFDRDKEPILSGFRTLEGCAGGTHLHARLTVEDFQYSSPEQRECGRLDRKADQYLLGLLAYEMIAGTPPVQITSWADALNPRTAEALAHPTPLHERVDCGENVSDVVMRMLSVDPEARFKSLDDVIEWLPREHGTASWADKAKASYQRCAHDDRFYKDLYKHLFDSLPEIRAMFDKRTMSEQYRVLRDALWLLLTYYDNRDHGEPTILSAIARSHARFEPRHFDQFEAAVLRAVKRHDPKARAGVEAWREAMRPGLDYLKGCATRGQRRATASASRSMSDRSV